MVAEFGGNDIKCSKYARFGSKKLARNVLEACESRGLFNCQSWSDLFWSQYKRGCRSLGGVRKVIKTILFLSFAKKL